MSDVNSMDTKVAGERPGRPVPVPSPLSAPFWRACVDGRLIYQRCVTCGTPVFPPQAFCPGQLHTDLEWEDSSGEGTVYSYTIVGRPQTPAFETPYVVAVVELSEGYTMMTNIVDCPPEEVHTGLRVSVKFVPLTPDISLPCFAPTVTST